MLVRIKRAPMSEDGTKVLSINTPGFETKKKKEDYGIWELPPDYKTGAYNSDLCSARQAEIDLAAQRRERPAVETKSEVINKLTDTYKAILQAQKDEVEIMNLPEKLRDKERKKRQSLREISAKNKGDPLTGKISEAGGISALPSLSKIGDNDGKPDDPSKADPTKPQEGAEGTPGDVKPGEAGQKPQVPNLLLPVNNASGLDPKTSNTNIVPQSLRDLPSAENRSLGGKSKKEIEEEEVKEDEAIYQIIDTVFDYNPSMEFLNLKFFSKYTENKGAFKFIIDGLHNLPKTGFYVTSYTLNPDAKYYIEDKKEDISVYTNFDWERSTKASTFYNEGYVKFKGKPFKTNLHFLIELARVDLPAFSDPEVNPVAWTILPVFVIDPLSGQGYVNSNIYQLPLFEGRVNATLATDLQAGEDPWATVMGMLKSGKIKYWKYASVYCRLLDIQREGHFQKSFDFERASEEYLPEGKASSYRFLRDDEEQIEKKKATFLKTTIPYQEDPYNFNKRLTEVCCAKYGIKVDE